ncbi:hypothetical protein QQF64_025736 [Cirrhinus molitorella]|uniref:Uncharacterized protein n=1 Tax=Cirrhinus molitorella TaxID=172907 RepID=A0ABR3NPZ6_9TELE
MVFKPAKSRSLVLKKGRVVDKFRFSIAGTPIPTICEKPIKSLGKFFGSSLRDTAATKSTCEELEGWLKDVDKSGLPGKFKAWIYQHGILPRILWPLLLYEFPITTISDLERRVSGYLRRWNFRQKKKEQSINLPRTRRVPNVQRADSSSPDCGAATLLPGQSSLALLGTEVVGGKGGDEFSFKSSFDNTFRKIIITYNEELEERGWLSFSRLVTSLNTIQVIFQGKCYGVKGRSGYEIDALGFYFI